MTVVIGVNNAITSWRESCWSSCGFLEPSSCIVRVLKKIMSNNGFTSLPSQHKTQSGAHYTLETCLREFLRLWVIISSGEEEETGFSARFLFTDSIFGRRRRRGRIEGVLDSHIFVSMSGNTFV